MTPVARRFASRFLLLAMATVAIGACENTTEIPTIEETTFAPELGVDLSKMTKHESGLYWRDVIVGTGARADSGDALKVRYTLWLSDGRKLEEITENEAPVDLEVGVGMLIEGWDIGIPGMLEGGRRQLVIPPWLGYGRQGYGEIPGNAIIVFMVDLVEAP